MIMVCDFLRLGDPEFEDKLRIEQVVSKPKLFYVAGSRIFNMSPTVLNDILEPFDHPNNRQIMFLHFQNIDQRFSE